MTVMGWREGIEVRGQRSEARLVGGGVLLFELVGRGPSFLVQNVLILRCRGWVGVERRRVGDVLASGNMARVLRFARAFGGWAIGVVVGVWVDRRTLGSVRQVGFEVRGVSKRFFHSQHHAGAVGLGALLTPGHGSRTATKPHRSTSAGTISTRIFERDCACGAGAGLRSSASLRRLQSGGEIDDNCVAKGAKLVARASVSSRNSRPSFAVATRS